MAGIDKTYTDNYQEYRKFKDWADTQVVTFFNGHTECIGDWVYRLEEGDFTGREIPIMNTPTWMDAYLIQNCPFEFVQGRMRVVYGTYYDQLKDKPFPSRPDNYKQNRKISIHPVEGGFHVCRKPFRVKHWSLQCEDDFWYHKETKTWAGPELLYPKSSNTAHIKSLKALVRHLRKQYLPPGITFELSGRYTGDFYIIKIH